MGKVILIGGSPMVGKSTAAIAIASKLKCHCISTDDIGEALQMVAPINPMQGEDYRDYYANREADQLWEDIKRYHKAIEPAIKRLVDIHSTWGNSVVIEGWALYPSFIMSFVGSNVSAVWLIANNSLLKYRLASRSDFLTGDAADKYLLRSKRHNDLLWQQCNDYKSRHIMVRGDELENQLAEKILQH